MSVRKPSSRPAQIIRALGVITLVAVGARIAYEVLSYYGPAN